MDDVTPDQKMEFCAALMSAARKVSIDMAYFSDKGKHRYVWGDPVGAVIEGPVMDDRVDALFAACAALQAYFTNIKPHVGKQSPNSQCNIPDQSKRNNTDAGRS